MIDLKRTPDNKKYEKSIKLEEIETKREKQFFEKKQQILLSSSS